VILRPANLFPVGLSLVFVQHYIRRGAIYNPRIFKVVEDIIFFYLSHNFREDGSSLRQYSPNFHVFSFFYNLVCFFL